jgi:triacylglycerol lipase
MSILYTPTRIDLIYPCQRGNFFPSGYPLTEAALCVEMTRLAYCHTPPDFAFPQASVRQVLARIGFSDVECFETQGLAHEGGTHCFLAINDDRSLAVLSFRGTDASDLADIVDDLEFKFTPWPRGGRVHEGFAHALASIRPSIDAALASYDGRLLITGHSLGAGIATLLASDLIPTRPDTELYTFGSPRCGDAAFAATVSPKLNHRYVDCCDKITRIPLSLMEYCHIGDPLYIDRNGVITANPDTHTIAADRLAAVEDYLKRYFGHPGTVPTRDLADHACLNYVSAVSGLRG